MMNPINFISYKIHLFLQLLLVIYYFLTGKVSDLMYPIPKNKAADWLLNHGFPKKSLPLYLSLLKNDKLNVPMITQLGSVNFIITDYIKAQYWFTKAHFVKELIIKLYKNIEYDDRYLILDRSWFLAIGHVAHINILLKAIKLGWIPNKKIIVPVDDTKEEIGESILSLIDDKIFIIREHLLEERKSNSLIFGPDYTVHNHRIRNQIRESLSASFWYGVVPGDRLGKVRWFAPYAAAVNKAAAKEGIASQVRQFSAEEIERYRFQANVDYMLPDNCWYVILHVREPGYHSGWSKAHPSARDAEIATYNLAIDYIIAQGGYVVRIGDNTMSEISPRRGLVDLTRELVSNEFMDLFLISQCKFYIGTNSGPSLIPDLFNKKCALTNWTPLAVPNWFSQDKFIPKLVYDKSKRKILSAQEMFDKGVANSQFMRDYTANNLKLLSNHSEDILGLVQEVYADMNSDNELEDHEDSQRRLKFESVILSNDGYIGSRIGRAFLKKYDILCSDYKL